MTSFTDQLPRARAYGVDVPSTLVLPVLSIQGRSWYDRASGESVVYIPRLVSYLSALRDSRGESDWREYFAWAAKTGFAGVRTFGGSREDQTPASAIANLPRYLEVATECGLMVEFTALTGTGDEDANGNRVYDPEEYIAQSAEIVRPFRDHVILELANEYEHGSQDLMLDDLVHWGQTYCSDRLWAPGAPGVDEPDPEGYWPGVGGVYGTAHLDRGRDMWNQCRRVREIYACSEESHIPVIDNEPLGADEVDGSVSGKQRSDDPAFFATLGALDRGFTGVGGCHHSQAGLDAVLPGPVQQACADAYLAAWRAVDGVLFNTLPAYKNSGHADSPVLSFVGAVREYSFTLDNRGVTVGVGEPDGCTIEWGNGWRPVRTAYQCRAKDNCCLTVYEVAR